MFARQLVNTSGQTHLGDVTMPRDSLEGVRGGHAGQRVNRGQHVLISATRTGFPARGPGVHSSRIVAAVAAVVAVVVLVVTPSIQH
ncbi:hypothetical protein E2C01_059074 [Portunus trituberculatus]|uniref:Uncharacterized protein n=1 Tax=Portunus trituberculatus TaxID=210409 RepID=A0A5B7H1J6_PORTR|nr:hypothetical protein [Portunus trituberculatus]